MTVSVLARPRMRNRTSLPPFLRESSYCIRKLDIGGTGVLILIDRDVIIKLLAFTLAMVVVPIGSYFATVNTLFKGT